MSSSSQPLVQHTLRLTLAGAAKAMAAAEAEAARNQWDVTICISDAGGVPLLVKRSEDAFAASYEIAVGKAKTAALFAKETAGLESAVNVTDGTSRAALLSSPFVLMRGGVPFIDGSGTCFGAVGVSGVKPEQDERVARTAVAALKSAIGLSNSNL